MVRAFAMLVCGLTMAGCATTGLSLEDKTARAIGLPAGAQVAISNDSGQGIVGHRYYTVTAKNGEAYNCSIFSNLGFEDRPQCVKQGSGPVPDGRPMSGVH